MLAAKKIGMRTRVDKRMLSSLRQEQNAPTGYQPICLVACASTGFWCVSAPHTLAISAGLHANHRRRRCHLPPRVWTGPRRDRLEADRLATRERQDAGMAENEEPGFR